MIVGFWGYSEDDHLTVWARFEEVVRVYPQADNIARVVLRGGETVLVHATWQYFVALIENTREA